jgi:arylsulfatase A-like enzyme
MRRTHGRRERGRSLLAALALGAAFSTPLAAAEDPGADWRCLGCNVLFISLDTLRADHLGSYGYERPTSPNIDRLAARALLFKDVLAQAPTTAPSHLSMFSSRYVSQHQNQGGAVIAEILSKAGYRTAAFVDGAQMRRRYGPSGGFGLYRSTRARRGGRGLEAINPRAVAWLERNQQQKFFLFVHSYDVHCPYSPPEPYASMFTDGYVPDFEVEGKCGGKHFNKLKLSRADLDYIAARYDGGIRHADTKLQELLEALGRLGLTDDTIVVLTSDHGESLGERGRVGHNEVYHVQLDVPLIIALPSGRARVVDDPVQSLDILPTLLSILGLEAPEGLSGIDLGAQLEGRRDPNRLRMAQTSRGTMATIHEGKRWALVVDHGQVDALYDLQSDPNQENDVKQKHPQVTARLFRGFLSFEIPDAELRERPARIDPQTRRELEALGYAVEPEEAEPAGAAP